MDLKRLLKTRYNLARFRNLMGNNLGSRAVVQWVLNALGVGVPATATTYTGPMPHWIADSTGTLINQGGLVNSAGQSIPPIRGATIATTEAGGATLGPELLSDNGFDNDAVWTSKAGWTISGGTASASSQGVVIGQQLTSVAGQPYSFTFTIVSTGGRGVRVSIGGGWFSSYYSTTGTHTVSVTPAASASYVFGLQTDGGTGTVVIDNLSCKKVIPTVTAAGDAMVFEAAATNKVTSHKARPTVTTNAVISGGGSTPAVLSLATDATPLATANLANVCTGNVFVIDNSAGDAVATLTFGGTTANTNKHSFSIWARKVSGAGTSRAMLTSGTGAATITGAAYAQYKGENLTPSGTTQQLVVEVGIGDIVRVILPRLQEAVAICSEIFAIPETTAAVTRPATDLAIPPPAAFSDASGFQGRMKFTPKALPGTDQVLLYDPTSGAKLYIKGADNKVYWLVGAKEVATAAVSVNTTYDLGWRQTAAGASISLDQTVTTDASMQTLPTWGTTLEIGSASNALYLTGEIVGDTADTLIQAYGDSSTTATWFSEETP